MVKRLNLTKCVLASLWWSAF